MLYLQSGLDTTLTELSIADRLNTALAQAALVLVARIDSSSGPASTETASALASVTREWRATLEAAVGGAQAAEDPLDQIARKRSERMARLTAGG